MTDKLVRALDRRHADTELEREMVRLATETGQGDPRAAKRREKALADEQTRRGSPLVGAMGGAVTDSRPDAIVIEMVEDQMQRSPRTVEERLGWGETNGGIPIAGSQLQRSGATIRKHDTRPAGMRRLTRFSDARERKGEPRPGELVVKARSGKVRIEQLRALVHDRDAVTRTTACDLLIELDGGGHWDERRILAIQRNERRLYGKQADEQGRDAPWSPEIVQLGHEVADVIEPTDRGARAKRDGLFGTTIRRKEAERQRNTGRPVGRPRGAQADSELFQSYADGIGWSCPLIAPTPRGRLTVKEAAGHHDEPEHQHWAGRSRPRYAYAFGFIDQASRLASLLPGVVNAVTQTPPFSRLAKHLAGMSAERDVPTFAPITLQRWFSRRPIVNSDGRRVVLWPDTFNNHMHTDVGVACVEVIEAAGWRVTMPKGHVCCGRPLYDYGFLDQAKRYLRRVLDVLRDDIRAGTPVVGMEPSCLEVRGLV